MYDKGETFAEAAYNKTLAGDFKKHSVLHCSLSLCKETRLTSFNTMLGKQILVIPSTTDWQPGST